MANWPEAPIGAAPACVSWALFVRDAPGIQPITQGSGCSRPDSCRGSRCYEWEPFAPEPRQRGPRRPRGAGPGRTMARPGPVVAEAGAAADGAGRGTRVKLGRKGPFSRLRADVCTGVGVGAPQPRPGVGSSPRPQPRAPEAGRAAPAEPAYQRRGGQCPTRLLRRGGSLGTLPTLGSLFLHGPCLSLGRDPSANHGQAPCRGLSPPTQTCWGLPRLGCGAQACRRAGGQTELEPGPSPTQELSLCLP